MPLTANREVDHYVDQELRTLPVLAGAHIYKGALVGLAGGYARGLVAGDHFAGIAYEEVDDTIGLVDGAKQVRVFTLGDFEHALAGASRANNGAAVYASDDQTLSLDPDGNSRVGRQIDVAAAGRIVLRLEGQSAPAAANTAALDAITHTAPGAPDHEIQNLVQNTGFGFVTADEGNTVLAVIANLQARLAEVEAVLQGRGMLAQPEA